MTSSRKKVVVVWRDVVLFVFGLAGISFQQVTGNVNFVLLGIYTAMTGVPGLLNLIQLSRGQHTESSSSSSVLPDSSMDSDSS